MVFGRRGGRTVSSENAAFSEISEKSWMIKPENWLTGCLILWNEKAVNIRTELPEQHDGDCGVFRSEEGLKNDRKNSKSLKQDIKIFLCRIKQDIQHRTCRTIELNNLLNNAEVTVYVSYTTELKAMDSTSRRFSKEMIRNGWNILLHLKKILERLKLSLKPVNVTRYQPMEREN